MTKRLFDQQTEVEERVLAANYVLLCLDYDGTLTAFAANPLGAALTQQMERALKALVGRPDLGIAIISGRDRADLQAHVNINGLFYAGNHGLEISGPGVVFIEPTAVARTGELQEIGRLLRERLKDLKGVQVEDKGLTASVHYRNAPQESWEEIRKRVHAVLASSNHPFVLSQGEKVFEIRPRVNWHKGSAVAWIQEHLGQPDALVIYVGDDITDEDAFKSISEGVTVKVRAGSQTSAQYQLENPAEVRKFLEWIDELLRRKHPEATEQMVNVE